MLLNVKNYNSNHFECKLKVSNYVTENENAEEIRQMLQCWGTARFLFINSSFKVSLRGMFQPILHSVCLRVYNCEKEREGE